MKKFLLCAIVALLNYTPINACAEKIGDVVALGKGYMMLVREFKSPESNDAFQRNLNIMMMDAKTIDSLKAKLKDKSLDKATHDKLAIKLAELEENFKSNDAIMQKAYAFSSNREYKRVFTELNICVFLKSEELSNLRLNDGTVLDPMNIAEKDKTTIYRYKTIKGENEILQFQKLLNHSYSLNLEIDKLRKKLTNTTDNAQQNAIIESIKKSESYLLEKDDILNKKYGIKKGTQYVMEISKSKLYMILSEKEVQAVQKEKYKK